MLFNVLLLAGATLAAAADDPWWKKSVIYQIYPLSFSDSDGDGQGDLRGIINHIEYLKELGIGAIWLSPIYESPNIDNGYDISNYTSINPRYGDFDTFDELVKTLHDNGMKLLMDFVPNHSSDQHPWFKRSLAGDQHYRNYYIWKSTKNNWRSVFNHQAWTKPKDSNMYYYHTFHSQQPDLNYQNDNVTEAMKGVLSFWMDRGVAGFRMDAVPFLVESNFQDERKKPNCDYRLFDCYDHPYRMDQPGTYSVLAKFRAHLNSYDAKNNFTAKSDRLMVVEAYTTRDNTIAYYGNSSMPIANMPFNFNLFGLNGLSNGTVFINTINNWMQNMTDGRWPNWVTGNHDNIRIANRMGEDLIDGMNMLNLLLPGTSFVYYGEELGMVDLPFPTVLNDTQGRDPERTPFQWNNSVSAGFTWAEKPWLPVNSNYWTLNVAAQKDDIRSHLGIFKRLVKLKGEIIDAEGLAMSTFGKERVFGFSRKLKDDYYVVVMNMDALPTNVNLTQEFNVTNTVYVHTSSVFADLVVGSPLKAENVTLNPRASYVLTTAAVEAGAAQLLAHLLLVLLPIAVTYFNS